MNLTIDCERVNWKFNILVLEITKIIFRKKKEIIEIRWALKIRLRTTVSILWTYIDPISNKKNYIYIQLT